MNTNQKHELTTILLDFCLSELTEFRQLIKDDNALTMSKTVYSTVMIEYIKTAENLCKLTYMGDQEITEAKEASKA